MPSNATRLHDGRDRAERRTTADEVFAVLHEDIASLRLLPGDKLSEVEVAARLDVSRQPVREAFIRLDEIGLVQIRPQKATTVRRFSLASIRHARFVRCAIETEVVREACATRLAGVGRALERNLERQRRALDAERTRRFHELDHEFHRLLCRGAEREAAFGSISDTRVETDRLCLLSLDARDERELVHEDHLRIVEHARAGDARAAVARMRLHLSRLDPVIDAIRARHPDYFLD